MLSQRARRASVLAAVVVYAAMWLGWRHDWGWLDIVDSAALDFGHDVGVRHHGWVSFWQLVCAIFGPTAFRLVGVAAVVIALVRRRLRAALFLVVTVELCEVVSHVAKGLAERPRPGTAFVAEPSWSFPSGHALAVTVGVLAFLTLLLPVLRGSVRSAAVVAGALIVVAVGVGRVALNVHHPSDVLAGWVLGYLYFLVCLWVVRPTVSGPARRPRPSARAPGCGG